MKILCSSKMVKRGCFNGRYLYYVSDMGIHCIDVANKHQLYTHEAVKIFGFDLFPAPQGGVYYCGVGVIPGKSSYGAVVNLLRDQ